MAHDPLSGRSAGFGNPLSGPKVKEIVSKSALNTDPYPGWDYSLNPYSGCYHACAYCYVPDVIHRDREEWIGCINVKRTLPNVLKKEVARLPRGTVGISSATDPYQPMEKSFEVTRRCLEVLLSAGWPVSILTRSPLVGRDIDLLHTFSEAEVGLSVPTLDDGARRTLEPLAPSIASRLKCLGRLSDAGLRTYICYAPAYPPTGRSSAGEIAEKFAATGCQEVYIEGLRMISGVRTALLRALKGSPMRAELESWTDKRIMGPFLEELKVECKKRGLHVTGIGDYIGDKRRIV